MIGAIPLHAHLRGLLLIFSILTLSNCAARPHANQSKTANQPSPFVGLDPEHLVSFKILRPAGPGRVVQADGTVLTLAEDPGVSIAWEVSCRVETSTQAALISTLADAKATGPQPEALEPNFIIEVETVGERRLRAVLIGAAEADGSAVLDLNGAPFQLAEEKYMIAERLARDVACWTRLPG